MIKAERNDRLLSELAKRGAISVREIAEMLGVSEATVRRDLSELQERDLVRRTHGGVTLSDHDDELPYQFKVTAYQVEKRRIGAKAASMISPHKVVGCTGGTTVSHVMRNLRGVPLTVITNAVNIAVDLVIGTEAEVLLTGGSLRGRSYELVGHVAEHALNDVFVDIAIIGVDGISLEHGLTTFNLGEAYVSRRLTERAREIWVVADHSKLEQVKPAVIASSTAVAKLITDAGAPESVVERYREFGIEVVLA